MPGTHPVSHADILNSLPVAVYVTDADGRLTFYNDAAAEIWGRNPELGATRWCGSMRLYRADGQPLPHDAGPVAAMLNEGRPADDIELAVERPDGSHVPLFARASLLKDSSGRVKGAICVLVESDDDGGAEIELERLAAIVSSSDDAIVSKTLEGRITSWNAGAERMFGYTAEDIVGQPVLRLIPPELHHEEDDILARLRRGERIEHFDTVRVAKDGERLDVSLAVSPLRDRTGAIVGASKVARDITERKRSEDLQRLLFDEINHRVKNTLATVQALARESLRTAANPEDFVAGFSGRIQALGRAHDVLVLGGMKGASIGRLVREQVILGAPDPKRIALDGPDVTLDPRTAVQIGLVLHELATNAHKYGAFSVPGASLSIRWTVQSRGDERLLSLEWKENGVPGVREPATAGFGAALIERSLEASGGEAVMRYASGGLTCDILLPLSQAGEAAPAPATDGTQPGQAPADPADTPKGQRILVVEDEPIIAMDIAAHLTAAGYEIAGPAPTAAKAKSLIESDEFDAALLDANLAGDSVYEIALALEEKGVPFSFATGYGREALPEAFRHVRMLSKPFSAEQLLRTVAVTLSGNSAARTGNGAARTGNGASARHV